VESGCRHLGLTAYQHLLQSNIDLVVLATPPGFMPLHFEAAVLAGKHVFMEAPVATDSAGIQRVVASGQRASDLGLVVATSWDGSNDSPLQRALEAARSGQLGQIQFARICSTVDACPGTEGSNSQKAYAQPRKVQRREGQSELEYQIRNWRDFLWSGGDNLVHQQARYLLACNDLLEAHPIEAHRWATAAANATNIGPPGQVGDAIEGQQVELTYANGVRLICETRRVGGARRGIHATLHGSRAWCDLTTGKVFDRENRAIGQPAHANWQPVNPVESQLAQLLENGSSPSSGVASVQRVAEATMTAILGRDAGWAGRSLTYDECLHSLHRVFDMDAIMHLSNSPPANSPLPQAI
jgi:predicted dehydrogenase